MAGSRLFITGGTGFFGIWLLESIAAANDALKLGVGVTVLSRDPASFLVRMPHLANRSEFDWLTGNPASFTFPPPHHDFILHLATATSAHLGATDPRQMLETKLASILRILDYARHTGARRLLLTSSGAVYGPQPADLSHIPETYTGAPDPMNPVSAYGNGKRMAEQMCALASDVDTVVARCFCFLGPHLPLDGRFAAGNFLRDAINGGPIVLEGDGRAVRSYLHAADLTIWLLKLLLKGRTGVAYNVGSDQSVSILELARRTAARAARPVDIVVTGAAPDGAAGAPDTYVPDISLARKELGLAVRLQLDEALGRTLAWTGAAIESANK
ncbi:MAG: NAD(P)-dependent oxidoreductase [Sulfuritalea sp.]|nr:NAD(P)-dependent oxidoreductase [Sulfuritalea sp.]